MPLDLLKKLWYYIFIKEMTFMEINSIEVFGIQTALIASGLPMTSGDEDRDKLIPSFSRGKTLGKAKPGSGHDCYLKGITTLITITAPIPFWGQWERYAFQDTVSSTSQMHRLKFFDLDNCFDEDTPQESIDIVKKMQKAYNEDPTEKNFRRLSLSVPQGFLYTRTVTTNYLQLKTMYNQRKNHKMREWRDFCKFIEALPHFKELVLD